MFFFLLLLPPTPQTKRFVESNASEMESYNEWCKEDDPVDGRNPPRVDLVVSPMFYRC